MRRTGLRPVEEKHLAGLNLAELHALVDGGGAARTLLELGCSFFVSWS